MITVELTYDMSTLVGVRRFDVAAAPTVEDVVRLTRSRFGDKTAEFEKLARVAAIAINGVLTNHRQGLRSAVVDGDIVTFVKAAAGG